MNKRKKKDADNDDDEDGDESRSPKKLRPDSIGDNTAPADEGEDDADEDEADEGGKKAVGLLLAVKWDLEKGMDPTDWWVSEKLDGVR